MPHFFFVHLSEYSICRIIYNDTWPTILSIEDTLIKLSENILIALCHSIIKIMDNGMYLPTALITSASNVVILVCTSHYCTSRDLC